MRSNGTMREGWAPLWLGILAVAGVAAATVAQHEACNESGYRLAQGRREAARLRLAVAAAEGRAAALRAPAATLARAAGMGLDLEYPSMTAAGAAADPRAPTALGVGRGGGR